MTTPPTTGQDYGVNAPERIIDLTTTTLVAVGEPPVPPTPVTTIAAIAEQLPATGSSFTLAIIGFGLLLAGIGLTAVQR